MIEPDHIEYIDLNLMERMCHPVAMDLLTHGVSMENVSMILGHSNTKITQKHYSPWIKKRQEALEADVRRVWG